MSLYNNKELNKNRRTNKRLNKWYKNKNYREIYKKKKN